MNRKIRYAVAGLGHIAQAAVLPAFKHAGENSELVALISDDREKVEAMSREYNVKNSWSYDQLDEACKSGVFDALYIALPNDMHRDFTVAACNNGIHVLCEKPMAMNVAECLDMIDAADDNKVKLMIAYRLHFEETNMKAVQFIKEGKIGEPRLFNSSFTLQVREGNIRTQKEHGGGPLYDIGVYCINAARYLFQSEPIEVMSLMAQGNDPRFEEVEESVGAVLKFPGERLATFVCGFGSKDISRYQVIGTKGSITLEPAYDYAVELRYMLAIGDDEKEHKTPKRDQFAPELIYFSQCIIDDREPEPSGQEGLNDLCIIEALRLSAETRKSVKPGAEESNKKPDLRLVQQKPGVPKPHTLKVEPSSM